MRARAQPSILIDQDCFFRRMPSLHACLLAVTLLAASVNWADACEFLGGRVMHVVAMAIQVENTQTYVSLQRPIL